MVKIAVRTALVAAALIALSSRPASAGTVTLAWNANTEPFVTGYIVSMGTTPDASDRTVDAGNSTTITIPDLRGGNTYYFAVQAYASDGSISDRSSEVSYTDPIVLRTGRLTYDSVAGTWSSPLHDQYGNTPANGPGWTVLTGDFDGDGWQDLFLYNATTGAFLRAIDQRDGNYSFFGYTWAPGWTPLVGDFNGDGLSDVFLYNKTTGQYFVCLSQQGSNDFAYRTGMWGPHWTVLSGDFNGDGLTDLFLYNANPAPDPDSGRYYRVLSQPDGSFSYVEGDSRWLSDWQITVADFDGDGKSDLFLYRSSGQWFQVFFTDTSETYKAGLWGTGWTITAGDFDGDHRSDLFLYNATTGRWFTVMTQQDLSFRFIEGLWAPGWQVHPTDFNHDGKTDLLLYNPTNGAWFETTTVAPAVFNFVSGTGTVSPNLSIIR